MFRKRQPGDQLYHIFKIAADGGVSYITSRAYGSDPVDALVRFATDESLKEGVPYESALVAEGDTCMVMEATEMGTVCNSNGERRIFRVERPKAPPFVATPVSL